MSGKLFLIPSPIGDTHYQNVIPSSVQTVIQTIEYFIVEDERTVRRYLIKSGLKKSIEKISFFTLNEHTPVNELENFIKPLEQGLDTGIISEAGCPCVADPGSIIVKMAHQRNIQVIPLVGPSSILLALMASGMNGQSFAFQGYLPVKKPERTEKIKFLEKRSKIEHQTQIFIEAPYRNIQLLEDLIRSCSGSTLLCVAVDVTLETEFIQTKPISTWKNKLPEIHKRPAIFLLLA